MAFLIHRIRQREIARIPRVYRLRINPLTLYSDVQFQKTYRITKQSMLFLAQTLKRQGFRGPLHVRPDSRNLSAVITVSITHLIVTYYTW